MKTHHWFIIIGIVIVGYVVLRGGEETFVSSGSRLNYDRVAVSQGMTTRAQELNLQQDLDVSMLPTLGRQIMRDGAQKGLKEQAFLQYVVQETSNRIREISTIDLNGDDIVDPILVKPEPSAEDKYVLLSIHVPAPDAYPLPAASDQAAWRGVETLEVATMTVSLDKNALTVEATPNQHVYPQQGGNHYSAYDRSPSFMQMYLGMRMMEWMFFPRMYGFYGAGYGYGMYRPVPVAVASRNRGGAISNRGYSRSSPSRSSAIRTGSGRAPSSSYGRAYSRTPPKSLSNLRSSASFQRRQASRVSSGGFGRSSSVSARSGGFGRSSSSTVRRGGFGRGFSSRSFGGGGARFGK